MRRNQIPDRDNLFRHCIYPVSFRGKGFASDKFVYLKVLPDGSLLASLAWERYVPTTEYLHAHGCRLAVRINEAKRAAGTFKDKHRHIYCGAYQLKGSEVRALATVNKLEEVLSADVIHRVEDGEIAHTDLKIVLKPADGLSIEGTKTAIVDRIWNACSGPLKHMCECDRDLAMHPNAKLSTAPKGQYIDSRSSPERFWYLIRFIVCDWLWRTFEKEAASNPG
jgi:hypothetical protein